jgi:hypothetical protein
VVAILLPLNSAMRFAVLACIALIWVAHSPAYGDDQGCTIANVAGTYGK